MLNLNTMLINLEGKVFNSTHYIDIDDQIWVPSLDQTTLLVVCRCTAGTLWRRTTGPASMLASESLAQMLRSDKNLHQNYIG